MDLQPGGDPWFEGIRGRHLSTGTDLGDGLWPVLGPGAGRLAGGAGVQHRRGAGRVPFCGQTHPVTTQRRESVPGEREGGLETQTTLRSNTTTSALAVFGYNS